MISKFLRAVGQLSDPPVFRVVILSVFATVALFLLLAVGVWVALGLTTLVSIGWLDTIIDVLGGFAVVGLAWLLFPAVVVAVSALMQERVILAVERRHYPGQGPARRQTLPEGMWNALKFLAVVAGLNILFLPLYFIPGVNVIALFSLNGYLLGREYFELVALRRLDPAMMRSLRSRESLGLFLAGVIIAFLSLVPFVNLLVPVIATAFMVHVFQGLRRGLPPGTAA